jgi:hypothetical protein
MHNATETGFCSAPLDLPSCVRPKVYGLRCKPVYSTYTPTACSITYVTHAADICPPCNTTYGAPFHQYAWCTPIYKRLMQQTYAHIKVMSLRLQLPAKHVT